MSFVGLTDDESCPFRASPDQMILQTSWILRFNIIYCTFLSAGCFIGIIYCIKFMRKHPIFSESTTILLYFGMIFAFIHDFSHVIIQWHLMYRSFYYSDDPCNVFFNSNECLPIGRPLLFGCIGMIYVHSALTFDGVLATLTPKFYYRMRYIPGVILAFVVIVVSFILLFALLPLNESRIDYIPGCAFFPKHVAERANLFLVSSLLITVVNLFINVVLFQVNKTHSKRLDYSAEFSSACIDQYLSVQFNPDSYRTRFDVTFQYQRSEAMMTSQAISVLVASQISALGVYAGGTWIFRQAKEQIPVYLYNNLVIWVYAISYATVSLPFLIIFCIKYVRRRRQRTIHNITSRKESQQNRMDELRLMWK